MTGDHRGKARQTTVTMTDELEDSANAMEVPSVSTAPRGTIDLSAKHQAALEKCGAVLDLPP